MTRHPAVLALLILAGSAAALLPGPAAAQTVIGQVIDHASGEPLPDVHVRLSTPDGREQVSTYVGEDGRFRLAAPRPGEWRVLAELLGYGTAESPLLELEDGQTMAVEVRMAVQPIVLEDPITVTAERSYANADIEDFHRRRQQGYGNGYFIHGEELRQRIGSLPSDLVRAVPGVTVSRVGRGPDQILRMRGGCVPAVFIDGMQINRYMPGESIDTYVDVSSIEGIEVYRGNEPGGRFYDRRGCGLVLVWTQRGEIDAGGSFSLTRLLAALGIVVAFFLLR